MPQFTETRSQSMANEVALQEWRAALKAMLDQRDFSKALKVLKTPHHRMMSVYEGVLEETPSGLYAAALQTDAGRVVLQDAKRTDRESIDPQLIPSRPEHSFDVTADSDGLTAYHLLRQLTDAGTNPSCKLLCTVELTRFDPLQHQILLPLLWQYIVEHRDSNNRDELVAVGAAIRKYIAIMPMERMGELAILLETGHRLPFPIDLEIEVAKMIYRNFEVYPPATADPHPELAKRLWEMVQAYTNPRLLLRDKHSAAASLAIEAIVAMRSPLAEQACQAANLCPYRWFAELVSDDLDDLHEIWSRKSPDAAAWLRELQNNVFMCDLVTEE